MSFTESDNERVIKIESIAIKTQSTVEMTSSTDKRCIRFIIHYTNENFWRNLLNDSENEGFAWFVKDGYLQVYKSIE